MHIFTHPACLKHTPPPDPLFAPQRLRVIGNALRTEHPSLSWHNDAPSATEDDLYLIHTRTYVNSILAPINKDKAKRFAPDTVAVSGTAEAARHAAGIALTATKSVMDGTINRAFCLTSPGGHHAEADAAGGFCFFNTIALAAVTAQKTLGAPRVAVVDFDAHHGNGTQSFFWNHEERLYISLHEETSLSGFAHETGAWNNVLNIPLPKGSLGMAVRNAWINDVTPKLEAFAPDILFVSAGFDMHKDDPLSSLCLVEDDFHWLGSHVRQCADAFCHGQLVGVLEGGYNLSVLGGSVAAFIAGCKG